MNAFGHLIAASWEGANPRFLLGSMLPDLATLVGGRIAPPVDPHLADGVRHHQATDELFHALPAFGDWWKEGTDELRAAGLRRHAARAASHVAIELLLDGELAHQPEGASLHDSAMSAARELPEPSWRQSPSGSWEDLVERLSGLGAPHHLREPEPVARRVGAALGRRPRLALEGEEEARVAEWLRSSTGSAAQRAETIVGELRDARPQ